MKKLVYGNWKMAQSLPMVKAFFSSWEGVATQSAEVGFFPSFVHLSEVRAHLKTEILGAQDCSDEASGAFTGEVSANQLRELGVTHVLVGHSERRTRFRESNELLTKKLRQALASGLTPVFCIGENLLERERGQVNEILSHHLRALEDLSREQVIIAYEPVWAIGTGKVAALSDVEQAHGFIRKLEPSLKAVIYGGSVKPENSGSILEVSGVDGLLVGGASLKAPDFKLIVESAKER